MRVSGLVPRLDQLLARNTGRSRREIAKLLRAGVVTRLDGTPELDGRARIDAAELPLELLVEGVPIRVRTHAHVLQHKPTGVVTAHRDSRHPTAWALLADAPLHAELRAVGRLDLDAAGLLLWTTDTARVHTLTHPKRAVPRTYQVALAREWQRPPECEGRPAIELKDGHRPRITAITPLPEADLHPAMGRPPDAQTFASITLLDGAYHEVKRVFAALGSHVLLLVRVAHAGIELPHELEPGAWRELDSLP